MSEQYPNSEEIEFAVANLHRHERELGIHERLILRNYRKMAIDDQKEILSHALERTQHYNNALIAGGYAAFFAAWSFFKNEYQNEWYDVSMLTMLFSVIVFVMWNVFNNVYAGNMLFRKAELIKRNIHQPSRLIEVVASFDQEMIERAMRQKKWWWIVLFFSIVPGAAGAIILFCILGLGILRRLILTV